MKKTSDKRLTEKLDVPRPVRKAFEQAKRVRQMAYAPYSNFSVGAAVIADEQIYVGCNVENASYGATVCAERVAMGSALSDLALRQKSSKGKMPRFSDVVVVTEIVRGAPPCALCLQVLSEFCTSGTRIWLANPRKIVERLSLGALYPRAFSKSDLLT